MAAKFDIAPALQAALRLGRTAQQLQQLQQRATGTLRRRMPVAARRDIQQEYNLTASRINKGLTATAIEGGVQITGSSRGIGLLQFGARQTRKGVTYAIKRGQRQLEESAFIQVPAKARASGPQVFVRKYQGGKRVGRYPIVREFGPQIAQMLRRPDRRDRLVEVQTDILQAEIRRLLGTL